MAAPQTEKLIAELSIKISLNYTSFQLTQETKDLIAKMQECAESDSDVDFSSTWKYADIVFLAEEKRIYANKMILSLWSPVFEAMFEHNFKEKEATEIKLPGKNFDAVMSLMQVLHPPNKEICENNVTGLLPLAQEYQIGILTERCEEFLLSQASSIRNFQLAQKYNLSRLRESVMSYLKRVPVARLRQQPGFDCLDQQVLMDVLLSKCERHESQLEELREVRMVLERKKPTTFPGVQLLCGECVSARDVQVNCTGCMERCCKKITEVLRRLEQ